MMSTVPNSSKPVWRFPMVLTVLLLCIGWPTLDKEAKQGEHFRPSLEQLAVDPSAGDEVKAEAPWVHVQAGATNSSLEQEVKMPVPSIESIITSLESNFPKLESHEQELYLRQRMQDLQDRSFDLNVLPVHQIVATSRIIRQWKQWNPPHIRYWPALRELLQNTMDHLQLLHSPLSIRHSPVNKTIEFSCGPIPICRISTPSDDEVQIEQFYTFPLSPRVLDGGVEDIAKAAGGQAGGFGDGFKTAAVAILAETSDHSSLEWVFEIGSSWSYQWSFESLTKPKVGTIASSKVLQVRMERLQPTAAGAGAGGPTMRQIVKSPKIGASFWKYVFPRMQMFWQLKEDLLLSHDKDLIARAEDHSLIGREGHPQPGVYVKGIWVTEPPIPGTLMSFHSGLGVNGRDRNDVDRERVVHEVSKVLEHSSVDLLRDNLAPLRGDGKTNGNSWLLMEEHHHFMNAVFEQKKRFILHQVLQIPEGSLFISKDTRENGGPFATWAAKFLERHGSPLITLPPKANRILFEEVSFQQLTERCSELILHEKKNERKVDTETERTLRLALGFDKGILHFLKTPHLLAVFSSHVEVPFVHGSRMYLPQMKLDREFLLNILTACRRYFRAPDSETSLMSLMQAILEPSGLPASGPFSLEDVVRTLERAAVIRKRRLDFLAGNTPEETDTKNTSAQSTTPTKTSTEDSPIPDPTAKPTPGPTPRPINAPAPGPTAESTPGPTSGLTSGLTDPPTPGPTGEPALGPTSGLTGTDSPTPGPRAEPTTGSAPGPTGAPKPGPTSSPRPQGRIPGPTPGPTAEPTPGSAPDSTMVCPVDEGRVNNGQNSTQGSVPGAQQVRQKTQRLPSHFPAFPVAPDQSDEDSVGIGNSSALEEVRTRRELGGGSLWCDAKMAFAIRKNRMGLVKFKIFQLRVLLKQASALVRNYIPAASHYYLDNMLQVYDAEGKYFGLYLPSHDLIALNLFAYVDLLATAADDAVKREILSHMVWVITHELAHQKVQPYGGHGPTWRAAHGELVTGIMSGAVAWGRQDQM